jgi:hypothetical protein
MNSALNITLTANDLKPMAIRIANAYNGLVENIQNLGGISNADAVIVANKYIKLKVVKLDVIGATYKVKNGAYFDADVINRAITF